MNASYAVIENGMVVNVIVWDGEAELTVPDNQQLIDISDISEHPESAGGIQTGYLLRRSLRNVLMMNW